VVPVNCAISARRLGGPLGEAFETLLWWTESDPGHQLPCDTVCLLSAGGRRCECDDQSRTRRVETDVHSWPAVEEGRRDSLHQTVEGEQHAARLSPIQRTGCTGDSDGEGRSLAAGNIRTRRNFGWRKSEILGLKVKQVDFLAGTIRLEVGTTKNREGREATMTEALKVLLTQCCLKKGPEDAVFTRDNGSKIRDFRKTWAKVCEEAKVPDLLFHDLRRTAARNLRNSGTAEEVTMKIGGWRPSAVFKRYSIVDQTDIRAAMGRLELKQKRDKQERDRAEAAVQEQAAAENQFGHSLGTAASKTVQIGPRASAPTAPTTPVN
jgi:hypothetical protein